MKLLELNENTGHLWLVKSENVYSRRLLGSYQQLLDSSELKKFKKFRFPEDRKLYLISHALLRTTLSKYANVEPQDWRFGKGLYGKPEVIGPIPSPVGFNLSHTAGLAVCATSGAATEIGVDIENNIRKSNIKEMRNYCLTALEIGALKKLNLQQQRNRFFDLWTLKEAYMKARGVGLGLGLLNLSFDLSKDSIRVNFGENMDDIIEAWRFILLKPTANHHCAVAVKKQIFDLKVWLSTPMGDQDVLNLNFLTS